MNRQKMIRRFLPAVILCTLFAGCGGGGGGSSSLPQTQTPTTPAGKQSVVVSITIPAATSGAAAAKRSPLYVSANTQSASIAVNGGTPVIANLSASSSSCTPATGGGRTCSVTVSAPVGTDTFTEILYASTTGTGTPLSQNTTSAAIVAGKSNVINMTLDGVVSSIALALANPTPALGTAASIALTVTIKDASGAAIIGSDPFTNPITLTDSDTSGATTLSKTTLASPADAAALTVAYTGAAIASATFGASATGVTAANVTPATLTPAAAAGLVDWPTYGFDAQRSGFNPSSTAITPASIANLHVGWQVAINGSTQSQPIVATNVAGHQALLIVSNFAIVQAYDALSGKAVWSRTLPTQDVQDCGIAGTSGTAQYVKSLSAVFVAAGNGGIPNHTLVYRLDAGTGTVTGQVDVTPTLETGEANKSNTGLAFVNGRIYLGTGSDCEGTPSGKYVSWRGRVVSVDPNSMSLLSTFFTTWGQGGNYGGGGVWGWGGVSADDAGNIYFAAGNGETNAAASPQTIAAPFAATDNEQIGFAEHLVKVTGDLATPLGSDYPGFNFAVGGKDLDYTGTPVVYQAPVTSGCGVLTATQGKGGTLVINNVNEQTGQLPRVNSFALSIPSGDAVSIGNPAYSPNTGLVYAAINSAGPGSSLTPPGLAAIGACGTALTWHTQFGPDVTAYSGENPRSAPTVTAGGVVFLGTPCTNDGAGGCGAPGALNGAVWAVDATTGNLLNSGKPVLITGDNIRMAPSVDGQWVFVLDGSGNMYGLTTDPSVKAVASTLGHRVPKRFKVRGM
jgi:hypothetical protein